MARRVLGEVNGAVLAVDEGRDGKRTSVSLDTSKATDRVRVNYAVASATRAFDSRVGTLTRVETIESAERLAKTTELVRNPTTGRLETVETGPEWKIESI